MCAALAEAAKFVVAPPTAAAGGGLAWCSIALTLKYVCLWPGVAFRGPPPPPSLTITLGASELAATTPPPKSPPSCMASCSPRSWVCTTEQLRGRRDEILPLPAMPSSGGGASSEALPPAERADNGSVASASLPIPPPPPSEEKKSSIPPSRPIVPYPLPRPSSSKWSTSGGSVLCLRAYMCFRW